MSLIGNAGPQGLLGEAGLSGVKDFFGLNLKGRAPQWNRGGSTILTKTYAFEIFPVRSSESSPSGVLGSSHVFFFGMNPTQINFTDFGAGVTTYTAGGVLIEGGATLLRQYNIKGRSGVSVRRGYSAGENPSVAGASAPNRLSTDGHRLFREMHKFLSHYADIKADPTNAHRFALAFHDFVNDDAFVINPRQFTVDRSGGGDFSYNIQFDAVADRVGFELNLLNQIFGAVDTISDVLSTSANNMSGLLGDITGTVAEAGDRLNQAMGRVTASVRALDSAVTLAKKTGFGTALFTESIKGALGELTGATNDLFDSSSNRDIATAGARDTTQLRLGVESEEIRQNGLRADANAEEITLAEERVLLEQGVNPPLSISNDFNPITSSAMVIARRALILLENALYARVVREEQASESVSRPRQGMGADRASRLMSATSSTFIDYSNQPVTSVAIYRGDTIRSISLRNTGGGDAVEYIIRLNNLKYPFISQSGEPFTLRYGQTIKVPSFSSESPNPSRSSDSVDRALFGQDFRLTSQGDMVLDSSLTDFSLIAGIDNLKQALEVIKFRTKRASNPIFPELGLPDLIGESSAEDNVLLAYTGAKLVAETDRRIRSVKPSALFDEGDGVSVILECSAINNTESFTIGVST